MQPPVAVLTQAYHPAPEATTYVFAVTVTNTASTLGTLLTAATASVPIVQIKGPGMGYRVPNHVIFQVNSGAANSVYMTWDGNTAPVVATPLGWEIAKGTGYKFENAQDLLESGTVISAGNLTLATSFKFVATADTKMLVAFSD